MTDKAKCKLCSTIIEISEDIQGIKICSCGEIGLGKALGKLTLIANDFKNIIRIDDDGKEYETRISERRANKESSPEIPDSSNAEKDAKGSDMGDTDISPLKPDRESIIEILEAMIQTIEGMPQHARLAPITHADYAWVLGVIVQGLKI